MREIERIDRISDKLSDLWHKHPDQRLGQLLENYVFGYIVPSPLFYVEDDVIEERIASRMDSSNGNEQKMNNIEEIEKELLATKERLERVLRSLNGIKDDEKGSVTLQCAFYNKTIQRIDLFEAEDGLLSVNEPTVGRSWGLTGRTQGPLAGKAFRLSDRYDWVLGRDEESKLCLVPTQKGAI